VTTRVSKFHAVPPLIRLQAGTALRQHSNLDLGAAYPIMLGESRQLRIQFDWFNVLNNQRAIRQNETLRTNSGIPGAAAIQFPNPFYGQGTNLSVPIVIAHRNQVSVLGDGVAFDWSAPVGLRSSRWYARHHYV
jgi:hypothetical protein